MPWFIRSSRSDHAITLINIHSKQLTYLQFPFVEYLNQVVWYEFPKALQKTKSFSSKTWGQQSFLCTEQTTHCLNKFFVLLCSFFVCILKGKQIKKYLNQKENISRTKIKTKWFRKWKLFQTNQNLPQNKLKKWQKNNNFEIKLL